MHHKYFAASNSAFGFKNYYPDVFKRADHIYIIKGGPGTGKSSLMKKYALRAESEKLECEYYYCSSDPDSLDGILIKGANFTTGFLDGTFPHVSEPRFPGAREEIINLGQFWNSDLLKKQQNEIIALSERKSAEYKSAYTFLRSVGNLRAVSQGLLDGSIKKEKMRAAVQRLLKDLPSGELTYIPAILDSVSMSGRKSFDTFYKNAKQIYIVTDYYGVDELILCEIFEQLKNHRVKARVSFDPICPEYVDGILLEDEKIAFLTERNSNYKENSDPNGEKDIIRINSKRFVDMESLRDVRSELRYTANLAKSSLDGALHALSKAKIYHFLLEDIYGKAMNWQKFSDLEIKI